MSANDHATDRILDDLRRVVDDAEGLRQFAHLRIATLKLAERLHAAAAGDLERIEERIEEFDRESERLLAETGGEVKKQRALLSHMLVMLRGNRGSSCVTYFTRDGRLRTAPAQSPAAVDVTSLLTQARRSLRRS